MARSNWTRIFIHKDSITAPMRMVGEQNCSAVIWIGKQTDQRQALVVMRDMRRGVSITNMAEELIGFVERTWLAPDGFSAEHACWLYRDSAGRWDRILPKRNAPLPEIRVDFEPVGDRTVVDAMVRVREIGFDPDEYPLSELLQLKDAIQ